MTTAVRHVTVDSRDPYALASWWAEALGGRLSVEDEPGERVFTGVGATKPVPRRELASTVIVEESPVPDWARRSAPQEARPSRPLAPSSIGNDEVLNLNA